MKICTKCGEIKENAEFHVDSRMEDGLKSVCKVCMRNPKTIARELLAQEGLKKCSKCGEAKEFSEFNKDTQTKDGLKFRCQSCMEADRAVPKEWVVNDSKVCNKCGLEQLATLEFFHRNTSAKDGLGNTCKVCDNPRRNIQWHRDYVPVPRKVAYEGCTKCKKRLPRTLEFFPVAPKMVSGLSSWCYECHNELAKERHRANPQPGRDRARQWAIDHPEEVAEGRKKWRADNPEQYKLSSIVCAERRRVRDLDAQGFFTQSQLEAKIAYWGWRCWLCGDPWEAIDHVIPISKGGSNWPANLRPACKSCNSRKGSKLPWDLLGSRFPLTKK